MNSKKRELSVISLSDHSLYPSTTRPSIDRPKCFIVNDTPISVTQIGINSKKYDDRSLIFKHSMSSSLSTERSDYLNCHPKHEKIQTAPTTADKTIKTILKPIVFTKEKQACKVPTKLSSTLSTLNNSESSRCLNKQSIFIDQYEQSLNELYKDRSNNMK